MSDLELAKAYLLENDLSIVIAKEGDIIAKEKGKGINPLLIIIEKLGYKLKGASIADKILGKAAAALSLNAGIKYFYGSVVSEKAIEYLIHKKINAENIEAKTIVPYILNHEQTDMCPLEKLTMGIENVSDMKIVLKDFLSDKSKNVWH